MVNEFFSKNQKGVTIDKAMKKGNIVANECDEVTLNYSGKFYKCELISLYHFEAPVKIVYDIFLEACLCGTNF